VEKNKCDFKNSTCTGRSGGAGASLVIWYPETDNLDGDNWVTECETWISVVGTFGSAGGVFSALELESLGFDELDLCLEMDLGRSFRIDEVDMAPRNRLSVASVL
jgi:hypothetical protein